MAYFLLTVRFDCPFCDRLSTEQTIAEAEALDQKQMTVALAKHTMVCQLCSKRPPSGTSMRVRAERATPEQLKDLGLSP